MADHPTRPTIKTLSEMTGFSIATISKALNDSPVVTQATKAAIRQAAGQIGYAASLRGMSLRTGRTYQVAVLMPVASASGFEWDGVDYAQILSGIAAGLEGSPYRMSVHVVRDAAEGLATARQVVEGHLADGLIFSGIQAQDPRVEYLCAVGFPFVTLGRCRGDLTYAHVDVKSLAVNYENTVDSIFNIFFFIRVQIFTTTAEYFLASFSIINYTVRGETKDPKVRWTVTT